MFAVSYRIQKPTANIKRRTSNHITVLPGPGFEGGFSLVAKKHIAVNLPERNVLTRKGEGVVGIAEGGVGPTIRSLPLKHDYFLLMLLHKQDLLHRRNLFVAGQFRTKIITAGTVGENLN